MAVLQKLRGWGIVLSILVALPLLLFIIDPSQIMQTVQSVSSRNDVGKINGKSVSYMDFQQETDKYQSLFEIMGNSATSEQGQKQVREAAWQGLLDKILFEKYAADAGVQVGKDEMVELTVGDNVSPLMSSNPLFADENGVFSPARVTEFVQAVNDGGVDPRYATYWDYLQQSIRSSRLHEKYNALFSAAEEANNLTLANAIEGNNVTANVSFVMVPFGLTNDTTIVVSDKEIRNYYKAHKDYYKQKASREIEYAVFEVVPSAEDIAAQSADFTRLYDEFAATENLRAFLQRNSDRQYSEYYYKEGELKSVNDDVDAFVSANTTGTSPVIQDGNTFYAARILGTANLPDSVYVRHMMFQGMDAKHLADSLIKEVKGNNFATLAALYSADKASATDGETGNIGWMTQNLMVPGFESVMSAKVGVPFIITTQYGTHIVEVVKATKPILKKQVGIFEKETLPSKETFNSFYNKANRLATLAAGKYENYKAAVDSVGAYSHPLTVTEATDTYGSIGHAKEVTRKAFDLKPGKVSQIITVDNNYFFVIAVKKASKEGIATIQEAAPSIKNLLYAEKYAVKSQEEVAEKIAGLTDLEAIAEKLGAQVNTQDGVAFMAMTRSLDPKFLGAIAAAKEGEISGPVAGSYGTYVFKVTGRETGSYYTEDDARTYASQLSNYKAQMLLSVMMNDTDVQDNRERFY